MVRVYNRQHIKQGIQWITDPLHLSSEQLKKLKEKRNRVVFDPGLSTPHQLSAIYKLAEQTGIPVVQRDYTIRDVDYTGNFNYNDGQYIGGKEGFQQLLDALFEYISNASQEVIDQYGLI